MGIETADGDRGRAGVKPGGDNRKSHRCHDQMSVEVALSEWCGSVKPAGEMRKVSREDGASRCGSET